MYEVGVVNACGAPLVTPVVSSMPIRQRFIVPERLLRKYSWRPSGDHTGFQSVAS